MRRKEASTFLLFDRTIKLIKMVFYVVKLALELFDRQTVATAIWSSEVALSCLFDLSRCYASYAGIRY